MRLINIKKDGFYKSRDEKVEDLTYHLNDTVEVDNDITLLDILLALESYDNVDEVFRSYTLGVPLEGFFEEIKQDKEDTELIKLEVSRYGEVFSYDDEDSELDEVLDLCGKNINNDRYAIEFTPLNKIKDLSVELSIKYIIYNESYDKIFSTNKYFTFGEFIGAILYEITFSGTTEQRDSKMSELEDLAERIDNGEEELIPMEDVMVESYQRLLDIAVEEENYEEAERLKKKINGIKNDDGI